MGGFGERTGLKQLIELSTSDRRVVIWAASLNFFVLSAYYILRPVREEIASQFTDLRADLFEYTFYATMAAAMLFATLTRVVSRARLVPATFLAFAGGLAFFTLSLPELTLETDEVPILEQALFVGINVYVFLSLSIIWSLLSDCFRSEQAKRVFGIIFFGGTLGQVAASALVYTATLRLERQGLLVTAGILVLGATLCTARIVTLTASRGPSHCTADRPLRGRLRDGLAAIVGSPQLLRICLYLATFTFGSTILYYAKTDLVSEVFTDRSKKTELFGTLDLLVGILSLLPQLFLTNRVLARIGLSRTLMILPAFSVIGFAALALAPGFIMIITLESLRRALNFIFAKPSREVLYTGVTTEQRFQSKPIIDTAWYRGTDWAESEFLTVLQTTPANMAWIGVPVAIAGLWLGRSLGLAHEANETEQGA